MHPRKRAGDRDGESLILKSAKREKGVKKIGEGRSRIAIRSTCATQREFGVFVRGGDYCFREETDTSKKERERETGKDSSIITPFHFNVLDVGTKTAELPPTVKSLDGLFGTDCVIDEFQVPETNLEQD